MKLIYIILLLIGFLLGRYIAQGIDDFDRFVYNKNNQLQLELLLERTEDLVEIYGGALEYCVREREECQNETRR